ncbi:Uncharacterised protein [Vibrio cholerae]|nr:Uncharacterised protein [Vibrio cholerae]
MISLAWLMCVTSSTCKRVCANSSTNSSVMRAGITTGNRE